MALSDREYRKQFYAAVNYGMGAQRQSGEEEYNRYYVPVYDQPDGPAGPDLVAEIINAIDFTTGGSVQLLSGYRGAGKTTELMRLYRQIDPDLYFPVYWDIENYFNTELPIDEGAFLVGLAVGFVENCDKAVIPEGRLVQRMKRFFERIDVSLDVSSDVTAGPLTAEIRAALRDDESFLEQVRRSLKSNRGVFRREVHAFFEEVVNAMPGDRVPVFIVDSIDHYRGRAEDFETVRASVESLFTTYAAELALPGMHVVYTVPIYVKPAGWPGLVWPVLNIKVQEKDGSECSEGVELLRRVLVKRAPEGDLERLLGSHVHQVIRASGGQFRDLFRLISGLLLKDGALPVGVTEIEGVERQERSNAAVGLSEEQWEILADVKRTHRLQVPRHRSAEAWGLQALGAVMCYRNGTVDWFGVHPLLDPLIPSPSAAG